MLFKRNENSNTYFYLFSILCCNVLVKIFYFLERFSEHFRLRKFVIMSFVILIEFTKTVKVNILSGISTYGNDRNIIYNYHSLKAREAAASNLKSIVGFYLIF